MSSDDSLDTLEPVVDINVQNFTDTERNLILQVIKRDEAVRIQEKSRIGQLKDELRNLREKGVPEGQEEQYGRVCLRCRTPLGLIFNSGAFCPNCDKKVCKTCRVTSPKADEENPPWMCTVCAQIREIRAESGAWFYDGGPRTEKRRKVYGSFLIKKMFTKTSKKRDIDVFKDPVLMDILEKDEPIPEVEDDAYLMISPGNSNDNFTFKEGKIKKRQPETDNKTVVELHTNSSNTHEKIPLTLLAEAQSAQAESDQDSCLGSEVTSPEHEINVQDTVTTDRKDENADDGIQSPGIYYDELNDNLSSSDDESSKEIDDINIEDKPENESPEQSDNELSQTVLEEPKDSDVIQQEEEVENVKDEIQMDTQVHTTNDVDDVSLELHEEEHDMNVFASDTQNPPTSNLTINLMNEETVFDKPASRKKSLSPLDNDVMDIGIDYSRMGKINKEPKQHSSYVAYNDLDLVGLQKAFVQKNKPKLLKLQTDEHSDKNSSSSSDSDDSDDDFIIQQVVPEKRNSFENDMLELTADVTIPKQIVSVLSDEDVIDKSLFIKQQPSSQPPVDESQIDFTKMQKIDQQVSHDNAEMFDDNHNDSADNEFENFFTTVQYQKKTKFSKERTEEHSEKEDSSSESSDDEEMIYFAFMIRKEQHKGVPLCFDEEVITKPTDRRNRHLVIKREIKNEEGLNFLKMEKISSRRKADAQMMASDVDLHSFHREFVRKSPLKFQKLFTVEHDEDDDDVESSPLSSDDDSKDCIIKQVVLSEEDKLENDMNMFMKVFVQEELKQSRLFDEKVLPKKTSEKQSNLKKIIHKEEEIITDFREMQKQSSLVFKEFNYDAEDVNDLNSFALSFGNLNRTKYVTVYTEEHDVDCTTLSSSDDDPVTSVHAKQEIPSVQINREDEQIDSMFNEYKQMQSVETDSIGSAYSAYDDFTNVAGEILLGFKYNHVDQSFEVQVHSARDLIAVDNRKNTSDPYVKIYLLPGGKKLGKRKTKAKKHSLNPEFDEVLDFKIPYEELVLRTCNVGVWHNHAFDKNINLGEVNINIQDYVASGFSLEDPSPQWHTLTTKKMNQDDILFVGNIEMNLYYQAPSSQIADSKKEQKKLPNPTKGTLNVSVVKAMNLTKAGEKPINAYFKAQLILDKRTLKFKSIVAKQQNEPKWESTFPFDVSWNELQGAVLQISLHDQECGLLGGTRLGLGTGKDDRQDSFGDEVDAWQVLLDNPNEQHHRILSLRSSLHSVKHELAAPPTEVKIITESEHDDIKKKKKFSSTSLSQNSLAKRLLNADTVSLASSGSMLSIYSMAGGEHGNLPITGEILFSLKHDINSGILTIDIEKAKGIAAVDSKKMTSDPYVKTYLLPDKLKTSKKKTTHRRKTINPVWNEAIKYKMSREELLKKTLQLTIWNHDRFGRNDFLGEVQVNMKHYAASNELETAEGVWYTLKEAAPVSTAASTEEDAGEILLAIKFDHGILNVQVKEARGLPAVDTQNQPSPFVKCYFLPDKSRRGKRKTGVQKKSINPVWNDKFEFKSIPLEDLQTRVLELTVWDHNKAGHQFLGGCRLGLAGDEYWRDCFGKEVQVWEAMIKHLGIAAEFTVPLRTSMTSRKGEQPVDIPMITEQPQQQHSYSTAPEYVESILPNDVQNVIRLALQYTNEDTTLSPDKKKKRGPLLKVHLKDAKNLSKSPTGEMPNTLCKLFMHPKKKGVKHKTVPYFQSLNPVWENEYVFENVNLDDLRNQALEIQIYDEEKSGKKGRLIGYVRLGSGGFLQKWDDSVGKERETWYSMLNNPNKWNMNNVPIRIEEHAELSEEPVVEEAKSKKEENKKQDVDENQDSEPETETGQQDQDGSESPRTSALRAMGVHAANVIDIMQTRDAPEQNIFQAPQESLTAIVEEEELESSGSMSRTDIPHITVTTNDVQPGDPPFERTEENEEADDFDMDQPVVKKQPPSFSLLKRSTSRESLTSIYSTDSANVYGHVVVRGELQFGIKYDWSKNVFEVHIFQAKDIAPAEAKKQQSDAFCKVYLLPDKTKASKRKTKTRKKTLHPEWEEILEYKIAERDLRTRTLHISLWHKERLGRNIFLGEVMLPLDHIVDTRTELEHPSPKWYTLCEKGAPPMAELFKGEIKIALMFEDPSAFLGNKDNEDADADTKSKKKKKKKKDKSKTNLTRINLHLIEGIDLPAADRDGFSDPFCKCNIIPAKSQKTKRKTPVIKDTLNPQWDYKIEYDMDYEDLSDNGIEFTVWDRDRNSRNDFLGCARINLGMHTGNWDDAEHVEIDAWRHLMDYPNEWKEFVIPLRSKMDPRPAKMF